MKRDARGDAASGVLDAGVVLVRLDRRHRSHQRVADPLPQQLASGFVFRRRRHHVFDDAAQGALVLFAYLGALTKTIGFMSGVLILPQRQTALVAKQAAEVDVLTGGRLRLGVGIGWNDVEYEALNEDFHNRGRRVSEQIAVLRALWTQPVVDFHGRWHRISRAGLNPLPVQRPIPLWLGGMSEAAIKRAARIGDGWFPMARPGGSEIHEAIGRLRLYALEAGRDPAQVGVQVQTSVARRSPEDWRADLEQWREIGANYVCVNTMGAGFTTPMEHIDAIRRYREAVGEFAR